MKRTGAWQLLLRRASEQAWPRTCWRTKQLTLAAGILGCVAGKATAQTEPSAQPVAAPLVGQVTVKSPLSTALAENHPRFALVPSLRTVYDSNVLRFVDLGDGPRDNIRVTPGIDLDYSRLLGRVSLNISGSAGYDYNSRFKFLNQSRINFNGRVRAPVGAICSFDVTASYDRATFDLNDTQTNNTQDAVAARSTILNYGINTACKRSAGFAPSAGFNYQKIDNSQVRFFNNRRYTANLGLLYSKPSVGTLSANVVYTKLQRPFIAELIGVNDDTDILSIGLGLNRAVSPRIRVNIVGGFTKAMPQRAAVRSFVGASYSGRLEWLPNSRVILTGTLGRQVTNQNGISATYVIREDYALSAGYKASAKSQITFSGSRTQRDFRGESLTSFLEPLRADRLSSISANYSYDLTRRLRISVGASQRWRKADNPFYNYKSTVLSSSIGAHF